MAGGDGGNRRAGARRGELIDRARAAWQGWARARGHGGWRSGAWVGGGCLVVALLVVAMTRFMPPGGRARLMPGGPGSHHQIVGFFENGWSPDFGDSFVSVFQHAHAISTVLAFWYSVNGDGELVARDPRPNVVRWVEEHHLRMGVLINNVPGPAQDDAGMLWTRADREHAIAAIVARARQDGYQELHIDFEGLPADARDGLTAFVRELKAAAPKGVVVSVSVLPPVGVPESLHGAYDYAALAKAADYLVLMAYDHHSSGGPAGPVSPLPWVERNVQALLAGGVPASKLVLGAGVYGYDWVVGSDQAREMPLTQIDALIKRHHLKPQWDVADAEPFVDYTDSQGRRHVIWYQDAQTVRQRLALAEHDRLRGIALWRLGLETPRVWSVIDAVLR